jgi:cysteinyl-tRNA synthetase
MGAGEQGEPDDDTQLKRDSLDFALWKAKKPDEDTSWSSPWGDGRPGWHIECSAMAEQILGAPFDIHGGGIDLVFPHHENEIAQTRAARGEQLAQIWMHNGMIQLGEDKMAKSVGNIEPLHEALAEAGRDALILYFLSGHYRQPLAFTSESLEQAKRSVERIRNLCRELSRDPANADERLTTRFLDALRDDFNTAQALSVVFEVVTEANKGSIEPQAARATLSEMLTLLGLENLLDPGSAIGIEAQELAEERERARRAKDFARADELRDQIAAMGYEVRDTPEGPTVVRSGR